MAPPSSTRSFYADMPPVAASAGMCGFELHKDVPADWCVVVVDIMDSTGAIGRGQYKDVNMVSASAIVAVLNATNRTEIAYIFGGDGATLLIPSALTYEIATALYGARKMAAESFNLNMRAGIVPVGDLLKVNAPVRVVKTETAAGIYQAAMSGSGIGLAEKLVKGMDTGEQYDITTLFSEKMLAACPPDFKGLECRWQPLQNRHGFDVSLIVLVRDDAAAPLLYRDILIHISRLCGKQADWCPVSEKQLGVTSDPRKLAGESRIRTFGAGPRKYLAYLANLFFLTWVGKACFRFGLKAGEFDGRTYKKDTVQNTDYIKFDNALRLIMDITADQKTALTAYLDGLLSEGKVFYGLHAASSALMTCMVFDYTHQHFHFVDGADGGYAMAAKQMKAQMKERG